MTSKKNSIISHDLIYCKNFLISHKITWKMSCNDLDFHKKLNISHSDLRKINVVMTCSHKNYNISKHSYNNDLVSCKRHVFSEIQIFILVTLTFHVVKTIKF